MASTSTSMGIFNTQLPQFNWKNYNYWAITMRALFASQDLWELVEDGFEELANENEFNRLTQTEKDLLKSNRKKDSKTIIFLFDRPREGINVMRCLSFNVFCFFMHEHMVKDNYGHFCYMIYAM